MNKSIKTRQGIVLSILLLSAFGLCLLTACNGESSKSTGNEQQQGQINMLSQAEIDAGWEMLWDGKTSTGWRSGNSGDFPKTGWEMKDGVLAVRGTGDRSPRGGSIITKKTYQDFELLLEFKLTPGANSGIKYFVYPQVSESGERRPVAGLEYQILDDDKHPDAKNGVGGNRKVASLYDLIPPEGKAAKPIGEWNQANIVVKGSHVEHWLNGVKTVEFNRHTQTFRALLQKSKYAKMKDFGQIPEGHILLQDHHDQVWFRNIKIREL
jgi:hypothetical protein